MKRAGILFASVAAAVVLTYAVAMAQETPVREGSSKEEMVSSAAAGLNTQSLAQGTSKEDLANKLVGSGVTVSNVTHTGASRAAGTFSGGTGILDFEDGIILSSGDVANVVGPNQLDNVSASNGTAGDADLNSLVNGLTLDADVLEFDFVPDADKVFFSYVFASDEYNEYVNSQFDDVFGFFINGQNCATVNNARVSINTINNGNPFGTGGSNSALYINNDLQDGGGSINTEMDGLTKSLTCEATVAPNQTNHIKLAIADRSDRILDSNVFLKSGSFSTTPPDNQPPTADAGGPYTADEGSSTNPLDGTGSDPENGALTYAWDLDNDGQYDDSTDEDPNFDASNLDGPSTHTVGLQVTDDGNQTATDTATVTVNNVKPSIASLSASSKGTLTGSQVTLTGQADDPSSADDAAGFNWKWFSNNTQIGTSGPPNTGDKRSTSFPYTFTQCGNFSVSATATDKDNAESDPASLGSNPFKVYDGSFKPPIDTPATNLTLKGKVLPVKITVGCGSQALAGLTPSIKLLNGNVEPGTEGPNDVIEAYSSSAADQTGWMRPVDGGYIYNLQVPGGANVAVGQQFTIRVNPFATQDPLDANPQGGAMYALLKIKK